jgi:hypothetical protein
MKHIFGCWGWGGTGGSMYGMADCARCGEGFYVGNYEDCKGVWSVDVPQPEKFKNLVKKADEGVALKEAG